MNAESTTAQSRRNTPGVVGLILSAIGLVICLFAPFGLVLSIIGLLRPPRTAAIIGTVLGVIGLALTPFILSGASVVLEQMRENAKLKSTVSYVNLLHLEATVYNEQTGEWPTSIDDLDSREVLIPQDVWGNEYRFQGNGTRRPVISSAGPDGVFDTEDDITNIEM